MKLSIVIPCYNESADIAKNVSKAKEYLDSHKIDYELIVVDDGSKDNTFEVISAIPGIKALTYKPNRGKGGAVKEGILNATGDYVLFMDADLSTDLKAVDEAISMVEPNAVIVGTRHHKKSIIPIKQPLKRRITSKGCRMIVNMKFRFHLTDTQCGFKVFETKFAKKMVEKQIVTGFAFDVEYLYIAKLNGVKFKELPVTWSDDRGSTVKVMNTTMKFFKDMRRIKKNKKNYLL